jgi:hypothetical protein
MATHEDGTETRIPLDLPLKGERKYVQSANILSELISLFSLRGPVKLEFRQMIYHPIYLAADDPEKPNRAGKFSFGDGDGWRTYGIFIDESKVITRRIENNEVEILAESVVGDDTATGGIDRPANFIDTIVALNKVLVGRYSNGKKAIFSAISLDAVPDRGEIGVNLVKKLGTKIFMSDVLWNGAKVGSLTFMTV